MTLRIAGTLPSLMAEDSRPGDWFGLLSLSSTLGTIAAVEAIGAGASYVALGWDALSGTLAVQPGAAADYESFLARNLAPVLSFSLRATLTNGTVETSAAFRITLTDRDDTPPSALGFAAGGSVLAGAIGAVIGTLRVEDPDTPSGPFFFTLPVEDDWRFEIIGGTTLKLRDGISLGLDDIPYRPLLLTVSDGTQGAGFLLDITVLDPFAPPPPERILAEGEQRGALALPGAARALVLRDSTALLDLAAPSGGGRDITLAGQEGAALPESVRRIDFLEARLALAGDTTAGLARALEQVLSGDAAPGAVARRLAALDAGDTLLGLAGAALPALADATAFVTVLYRNAFGRDPEMAELTLDLARLVAGEARAQLAVDLALRLLAETGPEAIWLPLSPGHAAPLPDAALPAPALAAGFSLDAVLG